MHGDGVRNFIIQVVMNVYLWMLGLGYEFSSLNIDELEIKKKA